MSEKLQCAVCYEENTAQEFSVLPCCHVEGSTTRFCESCMKVWPLRFSSMRLAPCLGFAPAIAMAWPNT
eukprot:scaffold175655_cov20-Prasinocladus_malaysianus.AAC.1